MTSFASQMRFHAPSNEHAESSDCGVGGDRSSLGRGLVVSAPMMVRVMMRTIYGDSHP